MCFKVVESCEQKNIKNWFYFGRLEYLKKDYTPVRLLCYFTWLKYLFPTLSLFILLIKFADSFAFNAYFIFFKIMNVDNFWQWISCDFLNSIKADQIPYNAFDQPINTSMNLLAHDSSSLLIGYPILRQLRVSKSIQTIKDIKNSKLA